MQRVQSRCGASLPRAVSLAGIIGHMWKIPEGITRPTEDGSRNPSVCGAGSQRQGLFSVVAVISTTVRFGGRYKICIRAVKRVSHGIDNITHNIRILHPSRRASDGCTNRVSDHNYR